MKVIIIGGGASGLMCAYRYAKSGASVTVLEKADRVGKKLLSTGNGKCNLSNIRAAADCYNDDRVKNVLNRYTPLRVIEEFSSMGLLTKVDSEGRVYPYCESANAVLNVFLRALGEYGVEIVTDCIVGNISLKEGKWIAMTGKGSYVGDRLVVACGSDATMGFNSQSIVKSQGHKVTPIKYAICPLLTESVKGANGVRAKAYASMFINGNEVMGESGELLFKDNALSGILAFRLSSALARYKEEIKNCQVKIDFFPDIPEDKLSDFIFKNCSAFAPLDGLLHKALAYNVLARTPMDRSLIMSRKKADDLAHTCKNFTVDISGLSSKANAQIACGGISLDGVDMMNMESKSRKGLYFIGECLDVDGLCGGYNLHWAWASAMAASEDGEKAQ